MRRDHLHLAFVVYALLLVAIALVVARTQDAVRQQHQAAGELPQWSRLGVPAAIRTVALWVGAEHLPKGRQLPSC
jgi:hypothetical protein